MKFTKLLVIAFFVLGCGNSDNLEIKERELRIKEKELVLREKELAVLEKETNLEKAIQNKKIPLKANSNKSEISQDNNPVQANEENLLGEWWMLHSAMTRFYFYRDGNFIFKPDVNEDESQKGSYKLENGKITLYFNDQPKKTIKFYLEKRDNQFHIEDGVYNYLKSDPK